MLSIALASSVAASAASLPTNVALTANATLAAKNLNFTLPNVRFVVISTDRDRASCLGPGNFAASRYFDATPGKCFAYENIGTNTIQYVQLIVSDNGVNFITYSDSSCRGPQKWASGMTRFGGCVKPTGSWGFSIDVTQYLPAPNPGQALIKQYIGQTSCANDPVYLLLPTSCFGEGTDIEATCGEGLDEGYTTTKWYIYGTKNKQCAGASFKTASMRVGACTRMDRSPGFPAYGAETVWCGSPCRRWKTLRSAWPVCDAPGSGSSHAVDMTKILGPRCDARNVGAGQCCYAPIGYAGGPPVGTDCAEVCLRQ